MSADRAVRAALVDSARRWLESAYGEERRRRAVAGAGFDADAWREMADLGWFEVAIPQEQGGLGLGIGDLAGLAEAIGAANLPEPVMAVAGVAAPLLAMAADSAGAAALLDGLLAGRQIVTLAHGEPAGGFAREHVATEAVADREGWRIDGAKAAVEGGGRAHAYLVSARSASHGIGLFMVGHDTPGLSVAEFRAVDGRVLADLRLQGARVPGSARLPIEASTAIDEALDRGALLTMAEAVGAMAVLLQDTLTHLKTREQFGQKLGRFQALQHRAVNMFMALEEAKAIVEVAADSDESDPRERRRAIATAKFVGSRSARRISREAVQMHGGIGITEELRVSHLFRRLLATESLYGDDCYYLDRFCAL